MHHFSNRRLMLTCSQLRRISKCVGSIALRDKPCFENACGVECGLLDAKRRAGTSLVETDEEFTGLDPGAILHENTFDDSALEVLNLLAFSFHYDGARCDDGTRQRSRCGPAGKASERQNDDKDASQHRWTRIEPMRAWFDRACTKIACVMGCSHHRPAILATTGSSGLCDLVNLARTSERGPNASTAPSRITRMRSTAAMIVGRCAMMTIAAPCDFSAEMAPNSASSPSVSRLAFGSSRMTSAGLP